MLYPEADSPELIMMPWIPMVEPPLLDYQCKHCPKKFIVKEQLHNHQRTHKVHGCEICLEKFSSAYLLKKHQLRRHTTDFNDLDEICNKAIKVDEASLTKEYKPKCDLCDSSYVDQNALDTHKKSSHEDLRFICEVCKKMFKSEFFFKNHVKTHDPNHIKTTWSCDQCTLVFQSKPSLTRHKLVHDGTFENHVCEVCGKSFTSEAFFRQHYKKHTGLKTSAKEQQLETHQRVQKAKNHGCDLCPAKFYTPYMVKGHKLLKHSTERNHICQICNKAFKLDKCLKQHMVVHTKDYKFKCDLCSNGYMSRRFLDNHKKIVHEDLRFICEVCKKMFRNELHFNDHVKTHDPNHIRTTWPCKLCPRVFQSRLGVKRHMRMHDGTLEKHVCDLCGKSYASEAFFRLHYKKHTGQKNHVCEVCGKAFTAKWWLTEHKRVHTKEKPFVCNFCKKGFSQKGSLNIHIRTHTKERPYKCSICEKGFITGALLKSHTCNL